MAGRSAVVLAVVASLVLLAGCGGLVGDDAPPAGDEAEEPAERELLDGLTDGEVTDSALLRREHYDALDGESYRTEWEQTIVDGSGAVLERGTGTQAVGAGGLPARVRFVRQDVEGTATTELWIDTEQPVVRQNRSGSVSYVPEASRRAEPTPPLPLEAAYDAVDSVTVEEGPEKRYVLDGTADELGSYESVSFRLVLAEEGYLTAYTLEAARAGGDGSAFAASRPTVEAVFALGPTDAGPDEPDWLEEGRAEIAAETGG